MEKQGLGQVDLEWEVGQEAQDLGWGNQNLEWGMGQGGQDPGWGMGQGDLAWKEAMEERMEGCSVSAIVTVGQGQSPVAVCVTILYKKNHNWIFSLWY